VRHAAKGQLSIAHLFITDRDEDATAYPTEINTINE